MKTKFLKPNAFLPMDSKSVSSEHVKKLIKQFSKDKHLLCDNDLERMYLINISEILQYLSKILKIIFLAKDKMNFDAVEKLCASRVIELLSYIPDSQRY